MSLFNFGNPKRGDKEVVVPQKAWEPDSSYKVADLNIRNWIAFPEDFLDGKYTRYCMSPARLRFTKKKSSNNDALEKAAEHIGVKFKNTAQDSLGRWFIGGDTDLNLAGNWYEFELLNLYLGKKLPSVDEARSFIRLLWESVYTKREILTVGREPLKKDYVQNVLFDFVKTHHPVKTRATLLEDYFEPSKKGIILKKNCTLDGGHLLPTYQKILDKDTLVSDKIFNISYEGFIDESATSQGLPNYRISQGDLCYHPPNKSGVHVAAFEAGNPNGSSLVCAASPSARSPDVGCYSFGKVD